MGIQFDGINNRVTTGDIVSETGTISGNLGIGGTLTYEDVTNVDSIGVVTARDGIKIGPTAGVAGTFFADGSYITAGILTAKTGSFSGTVTANSFSGDGSSLTGIDATAIKFGGSVKAQANNSGVVVTGIVTANSGADAVTFLKGNSVGIGSTTTAGRDAGIGTATGEIIYNASDSVMQVWTGTLWETVKFKPPINVSGGTISDSARSGYITHTFTSPGNFVTDGSLESSEIFVIGGGAGGGGRRYGAGGGAGGAMFASSVTLSSGTYGVSIGSGGNGGAAASSPGGNDGGHGADGGNSIFNPGGPQQRQGTGGGGGAAYNPPNFQGRSGGCGGGASSYPNKAGGSTTQPSAPGPGTDYGQPGGGYQNPDSGITGGAGWAPAGGGGAGQAGFGPPSAGPLQQLRGGGNGGDGVQLSISGTATYYGGGGGGGSFDYVTPPFPGPYPSPDTMKARGGNGGGGCSNNQPNSAPTQSGPGLNPFAAGTGGSSPNQHGLANTGSGGAGMAGAGGYNFSPTGAGGNGGSGLIIVAYPKTQAAGEVRF